MRSAEDRRAWLKSLKVGDEVVYNRNRFSGAPRWEVERIVRITPTGQIVTNRGHRWINGSRGKGLESYHIVPLTAEIRQAAIDAKIMVIIKYTKWETVSPNKLHRIYAILKEEE